MSARSPRSSLSAPSSAEVADDFGESLKDLHTNDRYQISNLTVIAKENTEHAQAISKTLESHIKTAPPSRKLPALYVLDSIVKNVGTPYTVYLGRNLYSTFMEAYTQVDGNTRRSMDAMQQTWKAPVPGSLDPRPVFPPETVRPIENALLKAKTAALQSARPASSQMYPSQEYRSTPTPPQYNSRMTLPTHGGTPQYSQPHIHQEPTPQPQYAQSVYAPPPSQQHSYLQNDQESVKRDVAALVSQRQAHFASDPFDQRTQQVLRALLELQNVLNMRNLDPTSLQQIRNQVSALSSVAHTPAPPQPQATPISWQPSSHAPRQQQQPYYAQPLAAYAPAPLQPPASSSNLLAPGALDGLQALLANGHKPSTPQMRTAAPALQHASHTQLNSLQNQATAAPVNNGSDLLAQLAKSGLLQPAPSAQPRPPTTASPQPPHPTSALLKSLSSYTTPTSQTMTPTLQPAVPINTSPRKPPVIPMTASSLKPFRPELLHALYDAQPNQCTTCGRRFLATPAGRDEKARHLDWHFRTNQRLADPAVNRGAYRDWYLNEMDWIKSTEFDPSTTVTGTAAAEDSGTAAAAAAAAGKGAAKERTVEDSLVSAAGLTKTTCSICFEELKAVYSEERQDWVFGNALRARGGVVHKTCAEEMGRSSAVLAGAGGGGVGSLGSVLGAAAEGRRMRSATPESGGVLGKRKAEGLA